MAQNGESFFTVVGCMDGRCQDVLSTFGREKFGSKYADTITEAGIVGLLLKDDNASLKDAVKFKVKNVSIEKHHANGVLVSGHQECAGNPVDDATQKDHIRKSVKIVKELIGNSVPVIGVFIKRASSDPSRWVAEEVPQIVTA